MNQRRVMFNRKFICKFRCIIFILACLLLNYICKHALFYHINFEHEYQSKEDSFEKLRNVCLSRRGVLNHGRNGYMDTTNRLQYDTIDNVVNVARTIQTYWDVVLVSVINDAYLPFAYSWLCNTANMDIHKSVLIITFDMATRNNLLSNWDKINVFALNMDDTPAGDQVYSQAGYVKIMILRTHILYNILRADINILLLEFDYVWFSNPLSELNNLSEIDILINPVSSTDEYVINGGLILIYATERSKFLWKYLTKMMFDLGERIGNDSIDKPVSVQENDQVYFSKLVKERYGNIRTRKLPLDRYADGVWYKLNGADRQKTKPVMISNNFIKGNINKMKRAKLWKHWFLLVNCTCDMQTVGAIE